MSAPTEPTRRLPDPRYHGHQLVAYRRFLCHYRWRRCVGRSGATSCKSCPLNTKRYRDSAYNGSFLESCLCKEDFWRHDRLPGAPSQGPAGRCCDDWYRCRAIGTGIAISAALTVPIGALGMIVGALGMTIGAPTNTWDPVISGRSELQCVPYGSRLHGRTQPAVSSGELLGTDHLSQLLTKVAEGRRPDGSGLRGTG
jgi:hypothetical protein